MKRLTEKKWKEMCKDCVCPPLHEALGKYANTPEYLRRMCVLMDKRSKEENFYGKQPA